MKVVTVVGTRPELIRLARVIARLDGTRVEHVLVHTGQNWDYRAQRDLLRGPRAADAGPLSSTSTPPASVPTLGDMLLRTE